MDPREARVLDDLPVQEQLPEDHGPLREGHLQLVAGDLIDQEAPDGALQHRLHHTLRQKLKHTAKPRLLHHRDSLTGAAKDRTHTHTQREREKQQHRPSP